MEKTLRGRLLALRLTPVTLAVLVWSLVMLVIGVRVLVQPHAHSVYPIFAHAGQHWLEGVDLYALADKDLDCYRYSPLVAALFAPLSTLPTGLGNVLWRFLNVVVYLGALAWWCASMRRQANTRGRTDAWMFLLVLPLSVGSLNNGQSNALVLGLLLAALAGVAQERWNLAGAFLAIACLFKVYPIAVGLLLVIVYPRRLGLRLVAALLLGLALPFLLQHPGYVATQYGHWLQHMVGDDRQTWPVGATYRDFRLLCRVWLTPLSALTYLALQLGVAAIIALVCLVRSGYLPWPRFARSEQRETLLLLLGLACCWMTVFGSATESCTYILLAPSLGWLLLETWREGRVFGQGMLVASYGILVIAQLAVWFPHGTYLHTLGPQPFAGLLLFGYLMIRACWRAPARERSGRTALVEASRAA